MKNYAHQQVIIDKDPKKIGLFLGTGSGKTLTCCLLAQGTTLVVCPKTLALKKTWETEWEKLGLPAERLTVLSKENFKKLSTGLGSFDTFIADECHQLGGIQPSTYQRNRVKYPKASQIFTATRQYLQRTQPERVYMATATPMPNPMVVYGLATLLGYNWDFFTYRDYFYYEQARNIFLVNKSKAAKEELARIVNSIGEVGKLQDWFDVPEQTYKTHYVEETAEQKKLIHEIELIYPDPLVQLGKRHQLEQGIFEGTFTTENKTNVIKQYAEEFKKIVVFAKYTEQINRYRSILGRSFTVITLTGKSSAYEREIFEEQVEKLDEVILIVQSSISEGWEVPSIPCMIFASESYSYVHREQSEGRILRANHLKKNIYITLVGGEIDAKVRANIAMKEDFVAKMHAENINKRNQK